MDVKVGVTGSRQGMEYWQKRKFQRYLLHFKFIEFHHGDCIGVDEETHDVVRQRDPNIPIIIHPPLNSHYRAYCGHLGGNLVDHKTIILPEAEYIQRNHNIVDACDILIAIPKEQHEVVRSGTWATVRYAIKQEKPVRLILPPGTGMDITKYLNNLEPARRVYSSVTKIKYFV